MGPLLILRSGEFQAGFICIIAFKTIANLNLPMISSKQLIKLAYHMNSLAFHMRNFLATNDVSISNSHFALMCDNPFCKSFLKT
jgi:hypothetical protein